jgi:Ca2+-binding RTX toxin-like protein
MRQVILSITAAVTLLALAASAQAAELTAVAGSVDGIHTRYFAIYRAGMLESNRLTLALSGDAKTATFTDGGAVILPDTHELVDDPVDEAPDFLATLTGVGGPCSTEGCSDPTAEALLHCTFAVIRAACKSPSLAFAGMDVRLGGGNDAATIDGALPAIDGGPTMFVDGGFGDDELTGGPGRDFLVGSFGHDVIRGNGRADEIFGDAGKDELYGGAGDDTIHSQDANRDVVNCGAGDDTVTADPGDRLTGCEHVGP